MKKILLAGALALMVVPLGKAQVPFVGAVVNAASFQGCVGATPCVPGTLSPGLFTSVFGANLSGVGLVVTLAGANCPVFFPQFGGQLNIQLPVNAAVGVPLNFVVSHAGGVSAPFPVTLSAVSPALLSQFGPNAGLGFFISGNVVITNASNPANTGDVLAGFGVGLGDVVSSPPGTPPPGTGVPTPPPPPLFLTTTQPTITVGGQVAEQLFSGLAPGFFSIFQTNFIVPLGLAPNTNHPVTWSIGGFTSPPVTLRVGCRDITDQVLVTAQQMKCKGKNNDLCEQTLHIRSKALSNFPANGTLLLTGLSANAALQNAPSGVCPPSNGVTPNTGITFSPPGRIQTATVDLVFQNPTGAPIAYGLRVLGQ